MARPYISFERQYQAKRFAEVTLQSVHRYTQ